MIAWILLHRITLGLGLLLAGTLTGLAFLFVPRGTSAPADAILISDPTPLAAFATPSLAATPAVVPTLPPALTVYASGAVQHPGVYTLVGTARVSDLLQVAGGPAPGADLEGINLAARLHDEDHVSFPYQGTPVTLMPPPIQRAATPAAAAPGVGSSVPVAGNAVKSDPAPASINLNTADAAALEALPGIGPSLAGRIVAYRTQHGPFARLEAVQDVSGIGPALYARMAPYLTLGR
ncbi:MAG: ComEA family DNA-binding protein [Chloroflexota bacterium]|nr:ComEA family DNA-binding protein [Chloroflexota bacterium]